MKISELMRKLRMAQAEYGDINVEVAEWSSDTWEFSRLNTFEVFEASGVVCLTSIAAEKNLEYFEANNETKEAV